MKVRQSHEDIQKFDTAGVYGCARAPHLTEQLMVDVAEPSLALTALCAFTTEADLHYLRRLGRSCARCADLFWARDGKARHRTLQREASRVRSLNDDGGGGGGEAATAVYDSTERTPVGMLAFIDIIDDAVEHGNLQFNDLILLARRTMQDDSYVLLYLLVYGIVTDRTILVDQIIAMGESWHDGEPVADPLPSLTEKPKTQIEGNDDDDDDDEIASAMASVMQSYHEGSDGVASDENEDVEASDDDDDSWSSGYNDANHCFNGWWPALGVHNTRVMAKYFAYLYPARTDLVFDDHEVLDQMTLAERLVTIATIWSSHNVAQLLFSTPVFRCNTSMAVLFACCNKLQTMVLKSADELAALGETDKRVLLPAGAERLKKAIDNPCKTLAHHFRRLGTDAAFCDTLARYVDPKRRPLLEEDELTILRGSVQRERNDDDGDAPAPPKTQAPDVDFDFSATFINEVDHLHVFWFACQINDVTLARMMVEKYKVMPTANENYAVRIAARFNSGFVLDWLLKQPDVDPGACNNAALCTAVNMNALTAVRLLLACGNKVDPSTGNNYSICRATELANADIATELLESGRVDVNAREGTPMLNALRHNMYLTAKALHEHPKFALDVRSFGALLKVRRQQQKAITEALTPVTARQTACLEFSDKLINLIGEAAATWVSKE